MVRKLTKEELERIRTVRKGRLITPTTSRKIGGAISRLLSAAVPPEVMVGSVKYDRKGDKDRKRGRPHGTYKTRYVPGYGQVNVPTHIYRKMMSKAKSDRRLAEAKRQAGMQEQYEAEQLAMQQDPRFQPQNEQFLEQPDMEHEARVAGIREQELYQKQVEQQSAQQPRPSRFQQIGRGVSRVGQGVNNLMNQMRQRQFLKQQRQMEQGYPQAFGQQAGQQPTQFARPASSQLRILSDKSSILNTPNIFNNPRRW